LHDLGKVGDLENDFYVEQDSAWHREKLGQFYKYNEDLSKMSITHQTLFLLQHFGVTLTRDEWIAIQLSGGSHFEENRFYVGSEPTLALILQQAKQITVHAMKRD
jgi:5-enolpyruvylshikimate-3-phosphate synthase